MVDQDKLIKLVKFTNTLKLLFVEDSKEVREQTSKFLENFFTDVTVCKNGLEGFESFEKNSFDLIITDLNMPVMNGIEMIKKIRKINSTIPILILSAHNEKNFIDEAEAQNISGYIIKPINIENYIEMISKIENNYV